MSCSPWGARRPCPVLRADAWEVMMSVVYSRNRFFDVENWTGAEVLGSFEDVVHVDDASDLTVFEAYEVSIEDSWPSFIRDQSL